MWTKNPPPVATPVEPGTISSIPEFAVDKSMQDPTEVMRSIKSSKPYSMTIAMKIPLPPSPVPHSDEVSHDQNEDSMGPTENEVYKNKDKKRPTDDESKSWEVLQRAVARHDDDMVKNYKEDIDTQLVFAGLFSAVVTAFLIESYQWLSEDPADTTVALLIQISAQLNGSQGISTEQPPFEADSSSIPLFGLLCKQWLREHQRDTQTRTPGEELALRQLRRDSFEKWGVSSFLSALPILLEVALLLFFVVMLSTGLYFVTTALPTLMMPGDQQQKIQGRRFDELSY
ncbi:hypothetical protein MPER_01007, partial [Moniliophthora perniciosa FA553]